MIVNRSIHSLCERAPLCTKLTAAVVRLPAATSALLCCCCVPGSVVDASHVRECVARYVNHARSGAAGTLGSANMESRPTEVSVGTHALNSLAFSNPSETTARHFEPAFRANPSREGWNIRTRAGAQTPCGFGWIRESTCNLLSDGPRGCLQHVKLTRFSLAVSSVLRRGTMSRLRHTYINMPPPSTASGPGTIFLNIF